MNMDDLGIPLFLGKPHIATWTQISIWWTDLTQEDIHKATFTLIANEDSYIPWAFQVRERLGPTMWPRASLLHTGSTESVGCDISVLMKQCIFYTAHRYLISSG